MPTMPLPLKRPRHGTSAVRNPLARMIPAARLPGPVPAPAAFPWLLAGRTNAYLRRFRHRPYQVKPLRTLLADYGLAFLALGTLLLAYAARALAGTFHESSALDPLSHVLMPAAGAPVLFALLVRSGVLIAPKRHGMLLAIVMLGVAAEASWEILEYGADLMFSLQWQATNDDTMLDIILAVPGSLLGGLVFWRRVREEIIPAR